MAELFHSLPLWLAALLVLLVAVAIGLGSSLGVHVLFRLKPTQEERDVAINLMQVVAAYIGIMLAFAAVVVWQEFGDAEVAVHQEAATAAELYRDLTTYGPETGATRKELRVYVDSVITDEWPRLRQGNSSPKTEIALGRLFEEIGKISPQDSRGSAIYQEAFSKLNDMVVLRRDRIIASQTNVPLIFWMVGLIGSTLTIAYASAFSHSRYNVMMISGTAITLGLVFLFILIVDQPFKGNLRTPSSDFLELPAMFDRLDQLIAKDEGKPAPA